jgi:hypothetical protein
MRVSWVVAFTDVSSPAGWGVVVRHGPEDVVEAAVALLGLAPVALDPRGHQVEHLRLQVHRAALRLPAAADQAGVLEHPQVLGDRLHGHVVGGGQLADRRVTDREPGDHVAPGRVGQRREHPGQLVRRHLRPPSSTSRLKKTVGAVPRSCQPIG